MSHDGIVQVQAELCSRIDGLRAGVSSAPVRALCDRASDVRHLAQHYNLRPVADLAWKLESRLARGERGSSVLDVLALMREATESGRQDGAWAAAASVRLM